jgi:hypothetical protein
MSGFDDAFRKIWDIGGKIDPASRPVQELLKGVVRQDSHNVKIIAGKAAGVFGGEGSWLGRRFNDLGDEAGKNEQDPVRGIGRAAATVGAIYGGMALAGAGSGAGGAAVAEGGGGVGAGAVGASTAPEWTSAAADSQLASSQLGLSNLGASGAGSSSITLANGGAGGASETFSTGSGSGGVDWMRAVRGASQMGQGGKKQQPHNGSGVLAATQMKPIQQDMSGDVASISSDPNTGDTIVTYRDGHQDRYGGQRQGGSSYRDFGLGDA